MTLGGPKRFLLKNREKNFHISGVAEQLENVSVVSYSVPLQDYKVPSIVVAGGGDCKFSSF